MKIKQGKATIIGVGLIGGSLASALKQAGWVVHGFDPNEAALQYAVTQGIIDRGFSGMDSSLCEADLVCYATPPAVIPKLIQDCNAYFKPGCLVTDVASIKLDLVKHIEEVVPDTVHYVGGHPMAGSEKSGVWVSSAQLFVGAPYILTPTERTDPTALSILTQLVMELGAKPVILSPADHDYSVAVISHLPHVVAAALSKLGKKVNGNENRVASLAAGGFRDTTRIATANPHLWRDLCLGNRERIKELLQLFREIVEEFEQALDAGADNDLVQYFTEAKQFRELF
jgi:prephenate dehydrogenase